MKSISLLIGSLFILALTLVPITLWCYGLYLLFSASIVLGLIALFVQPSPLLFGIAGICGHPELAQRLALYFGL